MSRLMAELNSRAMALGVPLSAHLDVTYRCNESCLHCYLPHDDRGEMNTAEIVGLLDQLADAGVFFLTISGGEPLLRPDLFEILAHARARTFNVKLKTNAILIRESEAERLFRLNIDSIQISIYSRRPEVHDAITKVKGSLERSIAAIRFLRFRGLKVTIADVLMRPNVDDFPGVQALAAELGAHFTMDPTITPHIEGDRSILQLNVASEDLKEVFHTPGLVGNLEEFCAPPVQVDDDVLDDVPCSAAHTLAYISPYGEVFPCVAFPLPSGNVRRQKFLDIWRDSTQLREVRSITARDLDGCSECGHVGSCTRCPGLAYMEGNMRGPSTADCEKSFARTGIPSRIR
jgi:radical SAM protein with 4Fe4S-binding SPASM domain